MGFSNNYTRTLEQAIIDVNLDDQPRIRRPKRIGGHGPNFNPKKKRRK